jgi:CheY-like chemotaxis protein
MDNLTPPNKRPNGTRKLRSLENDAAPFMEADSTVNPFDIDTDRIEGSVPWVIEFRIANGFGLVQKQLTEQMIVGRGSGSGAPTIDLTPFRAAERGVSRRHAIIMARKKFLSIRDLNSTNGTYLNGLRLMPDQDVPLEHGDKLRFGKLEVEVLFSVVPPDKMATADAVKTDLLSPLPGGSGKHILILENDQEVANVYEMMLKETGYQVTLVNEPTEAAAVYVRDTPDAVVMDLHIERATSSSDGLEVLRLLNDRSKRRNLNTPFIVVSHDKDADIQQRAKEAGASLFLPKPVRVDELAMRLGILLKDEK